MKLLYWQWTQNPVTGPFDYTPMMGTFTGTGTPAVPSPIGGPLSPDVNAGYPYFGPGGAVTPTRKLRSGAPTAQSDATVVGRGPYDTAGAANSAFSGGIESLSHNGSHVYIAGTTNLPLQPPNDTVANARTAGDQLFQNYAARDPFFFMLHAKVDELWARWQRKNLDNLDPATTYGTAAGNVTITGTMGPWDGTAVPDDGLPNALAGARARSMDRKRRPDLRQAGERPLHHLGALLRHGAADDSGAAARRGSDPRDPVVSAQSGELRQLRRSSSRLSDRADRDEHHDALRHDGGGDARHQLQHTPEQRHRVEERLGRRHLPGRVSQDQVSAGE